MSDNYQWLNDRRGEKRPALDDEKPIDASPTSTNSGNSS
jgi:hypothetical protein